MFYKPLLLLLLLLLTGCTGATERISANAVSIRNQATEISTSLSTDAQAIRETADAIVLQFPEAEPLTSTIKIHADSVQSSSMRIESIGKHAESILKDVPKVKNRRSGWSWLLWLGLPVVGLVAFTAFSQTTIPTLFRGAGGFIRGLFSRV